MKIAIIILGWLALIYLITGFFHVTHDPNEDCNSNKDDKKKEVEK